MGNEEDGEGDVQKLDIAQAIVCFMLNVDMNSSFGNDFLFWFEEICIVQNCRLPFWITAIRFRSFSFQWQMRIDIDAKMFRPSLSISMEYAYVRRSKSIYANLVDFRL